MSKQGSIFNRNRGEKRNGSDTRRRRSLCHFIISGKPEVTGSYKKEILRLRQIAVECADVEYPGTFYVEGKAIDIIFSFAYVEGLLTPSQQDEYFGAWSFLKDRWGL